MKQVSKVLSQMHQQVSVWLFSSSRFEIFYEFISHLLVASADDPQCSTPKSRKQNESMTGNYPNQNHLPTPTPPPGTPHQHGEGDYEMGASPQQWSGRTPASPVSDVLFSIFSLDILLTFS